MMKKEKFKKRIHKHFKEYEKLITRKNEKLDSENGIISRYKYPIITEAHAPVHWRFDLDYESNPNLLERLGVNVAFNAGAIKFSGKYCMVVRTEGLDRKSFFVVAESPNGIDNWRFWDYPIEMPQTDEPDTNVYDMRLTEHEDGWIYGLFCAERKDPDNPAINAAIASCGIARTKDLVKWERLPDLISHSGQQRNVVLHPEFVNGKYAVYTRPQDGFINVGSGGGIGWALVGSMEKAEAKDEIIIDDKVYHTIKELKNGQGPTPIKTDKGWLHLAHGVRECAAGLRYVLYMFMTDLKDPSKIIHRPGGYFMAPMGEERVGDVSNVLFVNGWIKDDNGDVFIYYASSDTRMHLATTTVDKLLDYCINTPEDPLFSSASVNQRIGLIKKNLEIMKQNGWG